MKKIKRLNEQIAYAKLYNQLKEFSNKKTRRGFSLGGLATSAYVTAGLNPLTPGFSYDFYPANDTAMHAQQLLDTQTAQAKQNLKDVETPYDTNQNATTMDALGELFAVFNAESNKTMTDAPNVSLSDVEGATQFVNESGQTINYKVDDMDTNIPKAMIAMRKEGMGKYDTLFNNQNNIKESKYYGKDVTQMTLGQVAEFSKKGGEYNKHNNKQYGANTTATGYYQMLGGTILDILERGGKQLGLTEQSIYNKENQDKMYIWYMSDTISRKKTLEGMRQGVMARWEAFRDNKLTEKRKDSKGETYNYYFPKDKQELEGIIFEHLRAFHPDHSILKSLGTKRSN